ncbi:transglutaminase domain-containing protein [Myxococcus stipitatus]|uniref:transglutaminase domain-containing protein n=1 Tax=Myxococcus stipitatus TaxID=83455 RepID=UPI0030D351DC
MVRLIRDGAKDQDVRAEALAAVELVRPHDKSGEIQAVWDYMTGLEAAPYRFDPVDQELLQGPAVQTKGRDCDCMVVKAGAMLESLGHPTRVVIGAARAPGLGEAPSFNHTWLEVYDRDRRDWLSFDPVLHLRKPGQVARLGDVLPHAVTRRFPVTSDESGGRARQVVQVRVAGGDLAGAQLGDIGFLKKLVKKVRKVAKKFDPTNPNALGGKLLRAGMSFVPGGGAIIAAADTVANVRSTVKKVTGIDPSKALRAVVKGGRKGGAGGALRAAVQSAAPAAIRKVTPALPKQVRSLVSRKPAVRRVTAARAPVIAPSASEPIEPVELPQPVAVLLPDDEGAPPEDQANPDTGVTIEPEEAPPPIEALDESPTGDDPELNPGLGYVRGGR